MVESRPSCAAAQLVVGRVSLLEEGKGGREGGRE
jgi:hypothetical protein